MILCYPLLHNYVSVCRRYRGGSVCLKGGAKSLLAKPDIKSAYCNVPGAPRRFPPPRYLLAGEDSCGHLSAIWPFAFVPKSATPFTVSARGLLCNILPTLSLHRRRKILKVGGAEYQIAREARTKFLRPRPLHVKPRPFLHDRGCYHEFLGEKINCKSSRIDLAAIEAHLLIIMPGKCLKICVVTILGWRTMGALLPFLEYWGGYSPPSPPGSYAYGLHLGATPVSTSRKPICQVITD